MLKRVLLSAAVLIGPSACLTSIDQTTPSSVVDTRVVSNSPPLIEPLAPSDSTSLWMQYGDPALLAARAANEGPLEIASKRHSCYKWRYASLGTVLADLGVNMPPLPIDVGSTIDCTTLITPGTNDPIHISQPAAYLYCIGRQTLGLAPYAARLAETAGLTTAGTTKLFDTLAAAATEIAKGNLLNTTRCTDASGTKQMLFDPATNACLKNGMACLQGYPPTDEQLALCSRLVASAAMTPAMTVTLTSGGTFNQPAISALDNGKRIAAAAVLANSLLCE